MYFSALSGLACVGKSVFWSIQDLQSSVRVVNSNIGTAGAALACAGKNCGHFLRRNSHTIIGDQQNHILILQPSGEYDSAGFAFFFQNTMEN